MDLTLNEFRDRPGRHHGSARSVRSPAPDSGGQVGMFTAMDLVTGEPKWVYRQRAGIGGSVLTTGGGVVFVKLLRRGAYRRVEATFRQLRRGPVGRALRLGLPQAGSDSGCAFAMSAAPGRSIHDRLLAGEPVPVARLAAALRDLRRASGPNGLRHRPLETERASALRMLERGAAILPELRELTQRLRAGT